MARPASSIACPACGQPFSAILEQIIDVQIDPTAKERLLSGRVNLITCPHCGYRGMVGTPLLYHDISKPLAIAYVPMELNLNQEDREKLIGDMTNALIRALPEDAPKGHLLQPRTALTLQGVIDQVLEADGITQEVLDAERRKFDLIEQLAEAKSAERETLLAENQDLFDLGFLEMLTAAAQAASEAGDSRGSLRLLNVREHLLETTEAGQVLQEQQQALEEAAQELEALGDKITRESFVDLLINAADNPVKVDALATLGRPILDYQTLAIITEYIDAAEDEATRELYTDVRERVLEISAAFEQQAQMLAKRATDTLQMLIQSPDLKQAIAANLDRIDDMFMQVLQVNLEEARKTGQIEISSRLKEIRDEVLALIQSGAPPEVQFINELLSLQSEEESLDLLRSRQEEVDETLLDMMADLSGQLREIGNEPAAQRLDVLRAEGQKLI